MLAYKYADNLERADELIEQDDDLLEVVVLARPAGVMNPVAEMLNLEEIKAIASYFSAQDFVAPVQLGDLTASAAGEKLHENYCGKCHEDGGANTADDVGLLAGQWKLYLTYLLEDLATSDRDSPKKMNDKMAELRADHGEEGIRQLIEYYAGQAAKGSGS
jgi:sulfide dehydrogenase cytochrome subunit